MLAFKAKKFIEVFSVTIVNEWLVSLTEQVLGCKTFHWLTNLLINVKVMAS